MTRKLRKASRRRAKAIQAWLALVVVAAALVACGHYGPPVRASRASADAGATAPAPAPDAAPPERKEEPAQ